MTLVPSTTSPELSTEVLVARLGGGTGGQVAANGNLAGGLPSRNHPQRLGLPLRALKPKCWSLALEGLGGHLS